MLNNNEKGNSNQNQVFSAMLDNLTQGVFMVEAPSGKPIIINNAAKEILGQGIIQDVNKQNMAEVYQAYKSGTNEPYPPEEMPIIRGMYGKKSHVDDMYIQLADGSKKFLEIFGRPVKDESGKVWASIVSFSDITNRKKIENELIASNNRYQRLFENSSSLIIEVEMDTFEILSCNRAMAKSLNMKPEEIIGKKPHDIFPQKTMEKAEKYFSVLINENRTVTYENERNGRHYRIDLIPFESNGIKYVQSVSFDITEQKKAEKDLLDSRQRLTLLNIASIYLFELEELEKIYQFMANFIYRLVPGSIVLYTAIDDESKTATVKSIAGIENSLLRKAQEILGYTIVGKKFGLESRYKEIIKSEKISELNPLLSDQAFPELPEKSAKAILELFNICGMYSLGLVQKGQLFGGLFIFTREDLQLDNREFIENFTASITAAINNKITRHKLAESESNYKLLNIKKSKFFNIIGHDLRSPFSSIVGLSSLLRNNLEKFDKEKIAKIVENIYQASLHTFELVENLLTWSRAESGSIKFDPKFELVDKIIRNSIEQTFSTAQSKRISIKHDGSEKNIQAYCDENMITTVLRNLISNGIKFTNEGGNVTINVEQSDEETLFSVRDSGIGMSEEALQKLFKLEEKISTNGTEKEKGTGLGLLICHEFIEKHCGRIWAESKKGKGSTFYFSIPAMQSG